MVSDPRGTANFRLRGLQIPVAGKTGTAESGSGDPHAWFAGYTWQARVQACRILPLQSSSRTRVKALIMLRQYSNGLSKHITLAGRRPCTGSNQISA